AVAKCSGRMYMQRTTGADVPVRHLAQRVQSLGINKTDARAVDIDVLVRPESVDGGTQQWGSGPVNLALHHYDRHAVDLKTVNLETTVYHCHHVVRIVRPPTVTALALIVNESIGP